MNLTKKQKKEIECLDYFKYNNCNYSKIKHHEVNILINKSKGCITNIEENDKGVSPEEAFFQISDLGETKIKTTNRARLLQLLDAKKWRLRMMDMYEQGVLDGCMLGYYTILGFEEGDKHVPENVMEFMAKTMFKGEDKELIRDLYYEEIKKKIV